MNFFKKFKWSITEPKLYPIMAQGSYWQGISYLLILVLIISGVYGYRANKDFQQDIQEISNIVQNQLPDFSLAQGKFKLASDKPFIKDINDFLLAVDTSGKNDASVLNAYPAGIFINEQKLVVKQMDEQREFKFANVKDVTLNKSEFVQMLPMMRWGFLFFAPLLFLTILLGKLFSVFALSFLGLILQPLRNIRLGYRQVWNMSLYALTLPMMIEFWLNLMGWNFLGFDMIFWALGLTYFWLGLSAFKSYDLIS